MDRNKRTLMYFLIGLTVLSVGMFGYANVYQPNFAQKDTIEVYLAAETIPEKVDLKESMFEKTEIHKDSFIKGLVTNIKDVEGKQLTGELQAGEPLFEQRLNSDIHSDGPLIAELLIPTTIPLKHNDAIRVYVQYQDSDGVTVEELFHEKRVISKDNITQQKSSITTAIEQAGDSAAVSASNEGNVVYVKLTDKEVMEYQKAVNTGKLYAVKIEELEDKGTLSSGKEKTEREPINNEEKEENNDATIASYEVVEGDTISIIAERFLTTEEKIKELNDGMTAFDAGDIIHVPGN